MPLSVSAQVAPQAASQDSSRDSWRDLAARYNAAWNAHDVPAIMAFHVEDTSYQRHGIPKV